MPVRQILQPVRVLEAFKGQWVKAVYRDGGETKAFYGLLRDFDTTYVWLEGTQDKDKREHRYSVALNHADVGRIVWEVGK